MLRLKLSTFTTLCFVILHITSGNIQAGIPVETPVAVCEIVTKEAIKVLPDPLRSYFNTRHEVFQQLTQSLDIHKAESHYVILDAAAINQTFENRLRVARQFPRHPKVAHDLYRKYNLLDQGGQLPWVILDQFEILTHAFEAGDEIKITESTASLLHFVTDACWPLNTTIKRFEMTQQSPSATISRQYLETNLTFETLRERLSYEIRVLPNRYSSLRDPTEAVFDELLHSFIASNELNNKANHIGTDERMAQIFEQRLESAAFLAARLIGTAWNTANKPTFNEKTTSSQSDSIKIHNQSIDSPSDLYVGSKKSNLFHTTTCKHAHRIKPGNVVRFGTLDDALKAGRKGCKTCISTSKTP